jgi:putative nucleotidyltransferase with HDIG domain
MEGIPLLGEISRPGFSTFQAIPRRQIALLAWIGFLVVGASAMCAGLVLGGFRLAHPIAIVLLVGVALAAEHESIRLSPAIEVSVGSLVFIFAAAVCGPLAAVVVGGAGLLADLPRRDGEQPSLRWLTWTAIRVIMAGAVGLTVVAVNAAVRPDFWGLFAAVSAAFVVEAALDLALTPVAGAIRGSGEWREIAKSLAPALLGSLPIQAPLIAALAFSYKTTPWSVALFVIPALAAHRLLHLYRRQRETAEALGHANARLAKANLSFATALVATLDARDRYTAGHSAAVAIYARDITHRMGLPASDQELAHLCGLVHDVGKIGLSAGLLEKPGALSLDERRQMEQHSTIGERILTKVEDYREIATIVRHHHERVDGMGYPDGLRGQEIPILSRVIAVADAYNAMTSDRPYRDAMPSRVARLRLAQAVESQFDTAVVAAFEAILTSASEEYRTATGSNFLLTSQETREFTAAEFAAELSSVGGVAALA